MRDRPTRRLDAGVEGLESRSLLSVTTSVVQAELPDGTRYGTLVIAADRNNNRVAVVEDGVGAETSLLRVVGYASTRVRGAGTFRAGDLVRPERDNFPADPAFDDDYELALDQYIAFERSDIDRIVFLGNTGNDTFWNDTTLPSILDGGSGNNVLYGGDATDYILAGPGNDVLVGNGGNDWLYGDARLVSYRSINGPTITVSLDRGGNDRLYGGPGSDRAWGGPGNDRFVGGGGVDFYVPGRGNDRFDQGGVDWWWDFWGSDGGTDGGTDGGSDGRSDGGSDGGRDRGRGRGRGRGR